MELQDPALLRTEAFIGGHWLAADDGARLAVSDPANGRLIGEVACCGSVETRHAIQAADAALPGWRALSAHARAAVLMRWHALLLEHADDLARLITAEGGKPLPEAQGEVRYGARFIEWFAEEGKRVYGDLIPSPEPDKRLLVMKQSIGVCAAITPWNFPLAMITRKAAPALAAGCTLVVKPAEATPLTALALATLAERAGLPPGVFNVVTGEPAAIGRELCDNPVVRKLSFTGSTAVGRLLMARCAPTLKRLSLELGGNAPFIVFDDADLEAAVDGALAAKYRNAGQTCVCANRFIVQSGIHDAFVERLAEKVAALSVGPGMQAGTAVGPLISDAAVARVEAQLADALARGATVLCGGERHALGGRFSQPTVLTGARPDMLCAREETFGPLAPVFRVDSEADAIALANDSESGLAGYFYTRDIGRAWRVAEALATGMVCLNTGLLSNEVAPFGGIKQSGFGREGSKYGMDDYLDIKYLCIGLG